MMLGILMVSLNVIRIEVGWKVNQVKTGVDVDVPPQDKVKSSRGLRNESVTVTMPDQTRPRSRLAANRGRWQFGVVSPGRFQFVS